MKSFSAIAFLAAAFAGVATAQVGDLPECGITCLAGLFPSDCPSLDFKCACANTAFVTAATACIEKKCNAADKATSISLAVMLCAKNGVDINPGKPSASVSDTPVETTPTEAIPTETTPTETDPVETDPAETDPVETDPAETDPVETDPAETDPAETTTIASPTATDEEEDPAETSAAASSSVPPPIETPNAGDRVQAAFGMVGLGLVAALAL